MTDRQHVDCNARARALPSLSYQVGGREGIADSKSDFFALRSAVSAISFAAGLRLMLGFNLKQADKVDLQKPLLASAVG